MLYKKSIGKQLCYKEVLNVVIIIIISWNIYIYIYVLHPFYKLDPPFICKYSSCFDDEMMIDEKAKKIRC